MGWRLEISVVGGLELFGWDVAEGRVQESGVVPVGPACAVPFDVVDSAQGPASKW